MLILFLFFFLLSLSKYIYICLHVPVHFPPFLGVMKTSKARLQGAHLGPVAHGAHGPVGTDVGPPSKVNRWVRWPNVATPRIIPIFTRNGWTFLDVSLFCYFWPCSFSTFTGAYRFGKARSRRGLRMIPQFLVSRMPSHPKGRRGVGPALRAKPGCRHCLSF